MISKKILTWNAQKNFRILPWKNEIDPYKIWISEIILQQTRAQQAEKYYKNILEKYPTIIHLANASQNELYSAWQGLGYYSRCRNMHHTAQIIAQLYDGKFPSEYQKIRDLKGIGNYTAAAIASFAFGLPYAVADGNVVRILSRYFGISTSFHTSKGKKEFEELAQSLLPKKKNASYNQAMMDIGATICKPQMPLCQNCPLQTNCFAFKHSKQKDFPTKKIKKELKERYFQFMVFQFKNNVYIRKRTEKDIWQNMYCFHTIEIKDKNEFMKIDEDNFQYFTQQLTHQKIFAHFTIIDIENEFHIKNLALEKVAIKNLKNFAFPKIIISFFEKNNYL